MTHPTIGERRARLHETLESYGRGQFGKPYSDMADSERASLIGDVIADLCHVADGDGLNTANILLMGEMHWEEERQDAEE